MPISSGPWGFWKAWWSEHVQGVGGRCTPGECLELLSPSPKAAGSSQKSEGDCRGELRPCTRSSPRHSRPLHPPPEEAMDGLGSSPCRRALPGSGESRCWMARSSSKAEALLPLWGRGMNSTVLTGASTPLTWVSASPGGCGRRDAARDQPAAGVMYSIQAESPSGEAVGLEREETERRGGLKACKDPERVDDFQEEKHLCAFVCVCVHRCTHRGPE